MNERIQELWEQATFDESRIVDGVYHPYIALQFMGEPVRYSITDEQKTKFAELIVRECASIVYKTCQDGDAGAQAILYEFDIDNARSQK